MDVKVRETAIVDRLAEIEHDVQRTTNYIQGAIYRLTGETEPNHAEADVAPDVMSRLAYLAQRVHANANRADRLSDLIGEWGGVGAPNHNQLTVADREYTH